MIVGWPLVTFVDALRLTKRGDGVPGFASLYSAALTRNVPPNQYAHYASLPGFHVSQIADVLLPLDSRGLHSLSRGRGALSDDVQDKARFEKLCSTHDLTCVPTIAVFDGGTSTGVENLQQWGQSFYVKALSGNRGAGAELWTPTMSGFTSSSGRELSIDELIQELGLTNSIVQPVLDDCAELRALGSVALSSLRVVTAKGSSIPATVIAAALSLANKPGSLTSHAGSLCGIDIGTGRITAVRESTDGDAPVIDPESPLIGFQLPSWIDAVELTCRAHDLAFPSFVTLGWDVALTPSEPMLIETNISWNMSMHQSLTGPLGETPLAEIIDELIAPAQARR